MDAKFHHPIAGCALLTLVTLLAAIQPVEAGQPEQSAPISWRAGAYSATRQTPDEMAATLLSLGPAGNKHLIAHFTANPAPAVRAGLEHAGLRLLHSVGGNAYFVAINTDTLDLASINETEALIAFTDIDPTWKLHPMLLSGEEAPWAVVRAAKSLSTESTATREKSGLPPVESIPPVVAVCVVFHRDVDLDTEAVGVCQSFGARPVSRVHSLNMWLVHVPLESVGDLAAADAVQWIEYPLPRLVEMNDGVRSATQVGKLQDAPYSLNGDGVNVLVYDGGTAADQHPDFGGRLSVLDGSGTTLHATHVSGTIGGSGQNSGKQYRGMAPAVTMLAYGFEQEDGLRQGFLYTDPGDLENDYREAIDAYGAQIANNSIGTNVGSNGFPCDWVGDYSTTDALVDAIVRGSLSGGAPFRVVWAAGNEREVTRCQSPPGNQYHSIAPPACAKNHLAIGAINSNNDSMTSSSSWGPTDDGRIKPELVAPGCETGNDNGVTSCNTDGYYIALCGTSMSAPVVTGIGALILQDYRAQFPDAPDPSNATLKALLVHSASDRGNAGPDYQTGYGAVRAQAAIDFMRTAMFVEASVSQDDVFSAVATVNAGEKELRITLAWDDPAAVPNINNTLVNDLDLRVFDPSNQQVFPWTLDPANPSAAAVKTTADHVNNLEQVFVANPVAGVYRIEVVGFSLGEGPQLFTLCASPRLQSCARKGLLKLFQGRYSCETECRIEVVDCDLNTDGATRETASVKAVSDVEPTGETVTLTETAEDSGVFRGQLPLSTTNRQGVLRVTNGGNLKVTYMDADDGTGNSVTHESAGSIDCDAPTISNIQVTDIGPLTARVSFSTSEPTRSWLDLGRSCPANERDFPEYRLLTSHAFNITQLQEEELYYFTIRVEDEAGNAATATNNGQCYSFETTDIVKYFTEELTGDFDLANTSLAFAISESEDRYAVCQLPISALPTDPSGGVDLEAQDDAPIEIKLSGNHAVEFYGKAYQNFYVGPNGYVTFGKGDAENRPTLASHFRLPRIAALFTDLDPRNQGRVSYRELDDRVAVSWENVPEFNSSNSNTFQIELFYDGALRVSWLQIDSTNVLIGLSEGLGVPNPFYETELNQADRCGPLPPEASSATVVIGRGLPLSITLTAADDGRPNPPGKLQYVISSLPQFELRDEATNHVIQESELPYLLADYGDRVVYRSSGPFSGDDSFTFYADDGGSPPEGGVSNTATITVAVGGKQIIYREALDGDPGWDRTGDWEFGVPAGLGSYNHDPTSGFTGPSVFGVNLNGDYRNNLVDPIYLTTRAFDCTTLQETELHFRRWLGIESAAWDYAAVEISTDNRVWDPIWVHDGTTISDSAWVRMDVDISAIADGQSRVFFRWSLGPTDFAVSYPGWNIDDIEVWAVEDQGLGDLDCDGSVDFNDIDPFVLALTDINAYRIAYPDCNPYLADLNGNGSIDFDDIDPFVELLTGP